MSKKLKDLQAAQNAVWEASGKLSAYKREQKRNAKLTPTMVEVLRWLAQPRAKLTHYVNWSGRNYYLLGRDKITYALFNRLRKRDVIASDTYARLGRETVYTITDHGRARLAEYDAKAQAA